MRAQAARAHGVPGTHGKWHPVGQGPLIANDPTYSGTYGEGFGQLAGRISDYSYDAKHRVLYASVASGGVWMSKNSGASWRSIGDKLPTQTVGSVAYSRAHGGTLIAVTGDNAFGGNTYGGMGVFRSTNQGRTWKRSRGVPTGAQGFKAAVDPQRPKVVYAATGAGLFRSRNDGRSFKDVSLPIGGACQGNTFRTRNCFFANTVTDVVVQAKDKFGNKGGRVLAAVGWRAGNRENFNGVPESSSNGLYLSSNGKPGTFKRLPVGSNGFAPQANDRAGRARSRRRRQAEPRLRVRARPGRGPLQQGHPRGPRRSQRRPARDRHQSHGHAHLPERRLRLIRLRQDLDEDGGPPAVPAADQRLDARAADRPGLRPRHPVVVRRVDPAGPHQADG